MLLNILGVLFLVHKILAVAVQLPPEIQKCSRSDPKFNECMATSITNALEYFKSGNKVFGFPPMNPFKIPKMEIGADPTKSVKLNQLYENVLMHGMTNSEVVKYELIDENGECIWKMEIHTPFTRMEADYAMTGQALLFPINGHGRCNVTLYGITNKHTADCEHYMKKGKSHLRLKNYAMDMSVEKCSFDFPNIIPGNEQISNELSKTLNENSLEIFQDVKQGFEQILSKLHEQGSNSVFAKIPEDDLFLK